MCVWNSENLGWKEILRALNSFWPGLACKLSDTQEPRKQNTRKTMNKISWSLIAPHAVLLYLIQGQKKSQKLESFKLVVKYCRNFYNIQFDTIIFLFFILSSYCVTKTLITLNVWQLSRHKTVFWSANFCVFIGTCANAWHGKIESYLMNLETRKFDYILHSSLMSFIVTWILFSCIPLIKDNRGCLFHHEHATLKIDNFVIKDKLC